MSEDAKAIMGASLVGAIFMMGMLGVALIFGILLFIDFGARWVFGRREQQLPPYTNNPGRRI